MQHSLLSHRAELMKTLKAEDGRVELRAVTGPDYGRIWDHEFVAAVMKIAGNGTVDTRWNQKHAVRLWRQRYRQRVFPAAASPSRRASSSAVRHC